MVCLLPKKIAHVRAIGFSDFNLTPVSILVKKEHHRGLENESYESYVERSDDITVMMEEAISSVLDKSSVPPETIDAVYFATETHWETEIPRLDRMAKPSSPRRALRNGLLGILHELGLVNAYPVALWMSDCGNACEALLQAKSAVVSGRHKRIIVVTGDRRRKDLPRISLDNQVFSDIATAILIDDGEGIVVGDGLGLTNSSRIYISNPLMSLNEIRSDMINIKSKFEASSNESLDLFDHYIFGNWSKTWIDTIVGFLKLDPLKIRIGTAKKLAHAEGSDVFLNLDYLIRNGASAGQRGVLVSTSPWSVHLISLGF